MDQFLALPTRFDFVTEGREAFSETFSAVDAAGEKPEDTMCFVWYLEAVPSLS